MINLICATSSITHSRDPQQTRFFMEKNLQQFQLKSGPRRNQVKLCIAITSKQNPPKLPPFQKFHRLQPLIFRGKLAVRFREGVILKGIPRNLFFGWIWIGITKRLLLFQSLKNKHQYPPWNSHSLKNGPVWKEMSFSNHQISGANCSFSGGYLFIARNLGFTTKKMKFFIRDIGTKRPAPDNSAIVTLLGWWVHVTLSKVNRDLQLRWSKGHELKHLAIKTLFSFDWASGSRISPISNPGCLKSQNGFFAVVCCEISWNYPKTKETLNNYHMPSKSGRSEYMLAHLSIPFHNKDKKKSNEIQ